MTVGLNPRGAGDAVVDVTVGDEHIRRGTQVDAVAVVRPANLDIEELEVVGAVHAEHVLATISPVEDQALEGVVGVGAVQSPS